jgi:dienelactone hydrolase
MRTVGIAFSISLAAIISGAAVAQAAAADVFSGSGVVISSRGEILTNAHVVESCSNITARFSAGNLERASLVARDQKNDLAVVRTAAANAAPATVASFREGAPLRAGDAVVALGYPLSGLLATTANLTVGNVSALAGLGDDSRYMQISAPVQPGNSGGPLLDASGHVVGIVTSKLNAASVARVTGDIPQNVNFALKAEVARTFLDSKGIVYQTSRSDQQLSPADVGDMARPFTVYIECERGAPSRSAAAPITSRPSGIPANPSSPRSVDRQESPLTASGNFVEEDGFFRVIIAGRPYRLEALTVKRADASGRLPIALIAHGETLDRHAKDYVEVARDLAIRGWLAVAVMRRGFGRSDGPMPLPMTCQSTSFLPRFAADADDLAATLDFVAARPDADPTRVIAIGVSAGGAAVMALSARNPKNLRGVINISGGLQVLNCPKEDALVQSFKEYGAKSRVPTLWMYARNDSFFGPDLVQRMRDAFFDGGGDVKFVMFDPIGQDGQTLFSNGAGRFKWLQEMDDFLRFHALPTWQRRDVDALIKRLNGTERNRAFVEGFLAAPFEKALARVSQDNYMYGGWGFKTIGDARNRALDGCGKQRPRCAIVMENNNWVGATEVEKSQSAR